MLEAAGIEHANKTNHSLRATAITRVMEKGVLAKLIMECSGHLTESGLSSYEQSTPLQTTTLSRGLTDITSSSIPKAGSTVVETSYVSREGKISVPMVIENTGAADIPEEKRDPSDLMKNLQFHNMQGCTFNISFKV